MDKDSDSSRYLIIIFLLISIILFAVSQVLIWGSLDIDTKIGPAEASLDAEFYEHGVNYEIKGNMSGGIIGGIGGIGGGSDGVSINIIENKTFLTGLGDFQENIGLILDSYNEKQYSISTSIWNPNTESYEDTKLTVTTYVDLIPWWPEGLAQKCSVTVKLIEPGSIQYVEIKNVKIILLRDFDETTQVYTESSSPRAQTSPNDRLSQRNQSSKYNFDVTISKDYGRVGILGVVDISIIDLEGSEVPENTIINLGKSQPIPTGRTTNIYTMTQGEASSIVLMVAAFPLTLICIILMIIAIPLVIKKSRWSFWLVLVATIIGTLAIIFYINGIETLVNLLDSVLNTPVRENFKWHYSLSQPIAAIGLLIVSCVLTFMTRPTKSAPMVDRKGKIKKSKADEKELPTFQVIEQQEDEGKKAKPIKPKKRGKKSRAVAKSKKKKR